MLLLALVAEANELLHDRSTPSPKKPPKKTSDPRHVLAQTPLSRSRCFHPLLIHHLYVATCTLLLLTLEKSHRQVKIFYYSL